MKELTKKEKTKILVNTMWDMIEDCEPDISTERLAQQVADEVSIQMKIQMDACDVYDYLEHE